MSSHLRFRFSLIVIFVLCASGWASVGFMQGQQSPPPLAHFHHIHLNTTDPAAAVKFYTSKFECEPASFFGKDAVWAQKSWILFNKVNTPPPWELTSGIWHFGWGAEDMKTTYQKQLDMGTKFYTPLTDISDIAGGTAMGRFFYAYVQTPDKGLIELNTAGHHNFGHIHMFSEDPVTTGEWYMKEFGLTRRGTTPPSREPRTYRGVQIGPSMSLMLDNVNFIIYPAQYSRQAYADQWKKGQAALVPTKGRVVDHISFSVDNLAETLERLKKDGVKISTSATTTMGGKLKSAFIEGPDSVTIELVEGHAHKD